MSILKFFFTVLALIVFLVYYIFTFPFLITYPFFPESFLPVISPLALLLFFQTRFLISPSFFCLLPSFSQFPPPSPSRLSFNGGDLMFKRTLHLEEKLEKENLSLIKSSASYIHQKLFRRTHPFSKLFSSLGFIMDYCTIILLEK